MAPAESEGPWQPDHGFLTQLTRRRSPSSCCMPAHNAMGGDPANSNNSDHCCAHDHHSHNSHNSSSPGHKHTAACCHAGSQGCDSHQQQQHSGHQHAAAACCGGGHDSNRSACSSAAAAHAPATPFGAPQIASVPLQQAGQLMHTSSSGGPVTTRIHAAAICCPMESRLIHSILDSVPGVMSVDVMVVTKMVSVHHNPAIISPAALVAALNSAGLQASLNKHSTGGGAASPASGRGAGSSSAGAAHCSSGCCGTALPTSSFCQQPAHMRPQERGCFGLLGALRANPSVPPLCVLASGLLLLVNLLMLLPGISVPSLLEKGLLALIAAAVAVPPVLKKAWAGLRNRNLDMNSLVVVALFGAIGLGDWFEAGALVVLFTLAEWLEERCVQRAAGAMEDILSLQPEEALVILQDTSTQPPAAHKQQDSAGSTCTAGSCGHGHHSHSGQEHHQHQHTHAATDQTQQHKHQHHKHHASGGCCGGHSHAGDSDAGAPVADNHTASAGEHSCGSHTCCSTHAEGNGVHSHAHKHHHHQQQQQGLEAQQVQHGHDCCGHDHSHQHAPSAAAAMCEAGPPEPRTPGACCGGDHSHQHAAGQHDHTHHAHQHSLPLKSVPVSQLPVGVLVLVRPGDKVPVDGTIEVGTSVLDESMITGESKPVTKTLGDAVLAGTVNCGSMALRVRATAAASNSTVARLASLMEAAAASKSQHDKAVELFARYYTPAIVLTALLVAAVGSGVQPAMWRHWTYMSLVVLVTGCPCALVISTPVATVAGLTRAAKKGVLIKGGRPLELLGNLTAASFDKSGTLTEGHFQLTRVHTFGGFSRQQALQLAAMLEQHSNHPIAHAIVGAAAAGGCMSAGGAAGAQMHVTEVVGKGLQGSWEGKPVAVGSWGFAQELLAAAQPAIDAAGDAAVHNHATCGSGCTYDHHLDHSSHDHKQYSHDSQHSQQQQQALQHREHVATMAEAKRLLSGADTAGSTVVCLVVEHKLVALLLLSDRARSDALAAVQQLQQLGVRCVMMTGDTMGAAAHVATQLGLGLEDVCAELLPQEKLELISTLRMRLAAARRREQQQRQYGDPRSWLSGWRQAKGLFGRSNTTTSSSGGGSGGSYCSSCGEAAEDCSCCAALEPNDSGGMRRSSSGGLKGTSGAGMRIDAAAGLRVAAASSSNGSKARSHQGVIIAHVGDGINDAPALAGADVGVAMGVAGAALAVDAADVALFSNNLTSLPFVVRLGRRASWVIAANTVFACTIKIAVLGAAAGGVASLWLSLLADVGSSLLVTLHALTLLRFEAGRDDASSSMSGVLYGSRLSGIPLVGLLEAQQQHAEGGGGAGVDSAGSAGAGGRRSALHWLQQLFLSLPGSSWLRPYDKLSDTTPGMSAAASRLPSSINHANHQGQLGHQHQAGCCAAEHQGLTPKAGQELREMAILACAGLGAHDDTTGLLAGGCGGGGVGAGGAGAHNSCFVIDNESEC